MGRLEGRRGHAERQQDDEHAAEDVLAEGGVGPGEHAVLGDHDQRPDDREATAAAMTSSRPVGLTAMRTARCLPPVASQAQSRDEQRRDRPAGSSRSGGSRRPRSRCRAAGRRRRSGRARDRNRGPAVGRAAGRTPTDGLRTGCPSRLAGRRVAARTGGRGRLGPRPSGTTGPRVQARRQGTTAGFAGTPLTHSAHGLPHFALWASDPR